MRFFFGENENAGVFFYKKNERDKKNERKRRKGLLTKTGPKKTRVKVMLEACCGGARPGHERRGEDDGGGLRTMHLIDLPNGHLKIDPDGEKKKKKKKKKLRRRLRVCF